MNRVKSPSDIPNGEHYQVIVYKTDSVYHEASERSRAHPGHGYEAYTETVNTFEQYVGTDEKELKSFIEQLEKPKAVWEKKVPYSVVKVAKKIEVKIETVVKI
jgi:6-phosphogluconate dehydrogenase (decarboxylating)